MRTKEDKWTEEEELWLINNYLTLKAKKCAEILGRTNIAIAIRAKKLNLKINKFWSQEEEQWLIQNYAKLGIAKSARILNRTYKSVRNKAEKLCLKYENPKSWTASDTEFLIKNYPTIGAEKSAKKLNRSIDSIRSKVGDLKIKYTGPSVLSDNENFRVCIECNTEKEKSCFNKRKTREDGLQIRCKECDRKLNKIYRDLNKERISAVVAKYKKANKEKIRARSKIYRAENKEKINKRQRDRKRNDLNFKLRANLSTRITNLLKKTNIAKDNSSLDLIGCSISQLKKHLSSQFEPLMSWDNYGVFGWHCDHIVAASLFDLTQKEQQRQCFHYTNLMPRWATTEIAEYYKSKQIGNLNKSDCLIDHSYYHLLENPS